MRRWRVGTFSMGVLLVAFGMLLLAGGIWGLNSTGIFLKWWPVILIALGVEILLYVGFSREEQPKIRFDGLSIFLVIFIVFLSSGVYAVSSFVKSGISQEAMGQFGFYKNESVYNKSSDFDASGVKKLEINNNYGKIAVAKYEGNKIKIDSTVVIKNNDERAAQELAANLIEVTEGQTLIINSKKQGVLANSNNYRIAVDITVYVPKELMFEVNNEFGDITLKALNGQVTVDNKYGKVEAYDLAGDVSINSSFGQVTVADISGKVSIDNEQGDISYSSKKAVAKDIVLKCKMGSITAELPRNQQGYFDVLAEQGEISIAGLSKDLTPIQKDSSRQIKGSIGTGPSLVFLVEQGTIDINGVR